MKPKPNLFAFMALIHIGYRNDHSTISKVKEERQKISDSLERLTSHGLVNGLPTAEATKEIQNLMEHDRGLAAVAGAIEHSEAMKQIPESERFATALTKGEQRDLNKISLCRLFDAAKDQRPLTGIDAEMQAEAAKEMVASGVNCSVSNGAALPTFALNHLRQRYAATQSVSGSNLGSQFVPTDTRGDLFQMSSALPQPILQTIGAFQLTGLRGNLTIPRIAPVGTVSMKTENATANAVDAATSSFTLSPKRLPAYVDVSDQLLAQTDNPSVEALLLKLLLERIANHKDGMCLNGDGSAPNPQGLYGQSGVATVSLGTNGAAPTWAHIVALENAVQDVNGTGSAYLTNTKVRGKLKTTQLVASSSTGFIWPVNSNDLNGYRTGVSNVVPKDLEKGASGAVCSAITFGDFSKFLMAHWGGLLIERHRDATTSIAGYTRMLAVEFFDCVALQPFSFATAKDVLTA